MRLHTLIALAALLGAACSGGPSRDAACDAGCKTADGGVATGFGVEFCTASEQGACTAATLALGDAGCIEVPACSCIVSAATGSDSCGGSVGGVRQ